jgi:hypothetical protein
MDNFNDENLFSKNDIKPFTRYAKATKRRFYSSNGNSFSAGFAEIRIPVSVNGLLSNQDASLNFTSTFTAGAITAKYDFSAFSFFSQIRVESNGVILEQIDDPGLLYNTMSQWNWTTSDIIKNNNKGLGMINLPAVASGILIKTGATVATGGDKISLPLNELLGIFSASKNIPLQNTSGLTVVCTLNPLTSRAYFSAATGITTENITVSDIYLSVTCIETNQDYEQSLQMVKSEDQFKAVNILMTTARRYVGNVGAGALSNSQIQINDRSKSAVGVWAVARITSDVTAQYATSNSSSNFPTYVNHALIINGQQYPVAGINTYSELAEESFKVANQYRKQCPDKWTEGGLVPRSMISTGTDGTGANGISSDTNCLSVNLYKTGYDETMYGAGFDLSASNSPNVLQLSYTPSAASTVTVWVLSQAVLHIDANGILSTEI